MLIVIFTAVFAFAVAFFVVGIRVQGYFDLQTGTFVVDAFVFGNIHVFRYKAFECSGNFYVQINSRELKKVALKRKKSGIGGEKEDQGDGSGINVTQKISAFTDAVARLPEIRLNRLRAYLTIGTGDSMETSLVAAGIAAALGAVNVAMRDKIKVKQGDIAVFPNFRHENTVLTFDVDAGKGTLGLIFAVLRLAMKVKRSRAEAKRKTA